MPAQRTVYLLGPIADGGDRLCVFVPKSPNPITGRLYFTSMQRCQFPPVSSKEALKTVVSSGNYLPAGFGAPSPPASTWGRFAASESVIACDMRRLNRTMAIPGA